MLVGLAMLLVDARLSFDRGRTIARLENLCISSGKQVSMIAAIILCASIIIGVLSITGLGVKITSVILSGSGGLLWPSLLLTALACLVLGMEVPTTAAYVICVSVAGPALIKLGLEPLQAHLFVFWFALLSTITPPVCGAVFIAAGMIGENWMKVALTAMALGVGLYLIPLALIANPDDSAIGRRPGISTADFPSARCWSFSHFIWADWIQETGAENPGDPVRLRRHICRTCFVPIDQPRLLAVLLQAQQSLTMVHKTPSCVKRRTSWLEYPSSAQICSLS